MVTRAVKWNTDTDVPPIPPDYIYKRMRWADLEHNTGTLHLTKLQELVAECQVANKPLGLRIQPVIPFDWQNRQWAMPTDIPAVLDTNGNCYVPLWDSPTFLQRWERLLQAVATYLQTSGVDVWCLELSPYGYWGEGHLYNADAEVPRADEATLREFVDLPFRVFDPEFLRRMFFISSDEPIMFQYAPTKGVHCFFRDSGGNPHFTRPWDLYPETAALYDTVRAETYHPINYDPFLYLQQIQTYGIQYVSLGHLGYSQKTPEEQAVIRQLFEVAATFPIPGSSTPPPPPPEEADLWLNVLIPALRDYIALNPKITALLGGPVEETIIGEGFLREDTPRPCLLTTVIAEGNTDAGRGTGRVQIILYAIDRGRGYYNIEQLIPLLRQHLRKERDVLTALTFDASVGFSVLGVEPPGTTASTTIAPHLGEARGIYLYITILDFYDAV